MPIPLGWLKVNMDGAAFGSLGLDSCIGIFRSYRDFVKGSFFFPLYVWFPFEAELAVVVHVIDYTWTFGLQHLWLESDSGFLVSLVLAFSLE